ncbi:WD40-like repeat protein [Halovivax ruber XH-70]|uniref:WD40-like repeat protein n=2 Tax=Halovivax ruber TaxID=387341 RepID=L0I7P8_HALRX|nr:WD40-like repeat protein [Halovivax ruber XH-70]
MASDLTRRNVLAVTGSALFTAVAGCTTDGESDGDDNEEALDSRVDERVDGEWLLHRATPENTAATDGSGPDGEPSIAWERAVGAKSGIDPLVVDSLVFAYPPDGRDVGTLEAATGEPTAAGPLASGELAMGSDGETVVAYRERDDGDELVGRDLETGEETWTTDATDLSTPLLTMRDGVAYQGGSTQPYGQAFDVDDGDDRWESESSLPIDFAVDDEIVAYASDEILAALEADSGDQRWVEEFDAALSTPPLIEDHVVSATADGSVLAVDSSGDLDWRKQVADGAVTALAAAEGRLFVGTESGVVALDADSGDEVTRSTISDAVRALAVGADNCYAITTETDGDDPENRLVALESGSLESAWSVEVPGAVRSRPVILDGMVLVRVLPSAAVDESDFDETLLAFA